MTSAFYSVKHSRGAEGEGGSTVTGSNKEDIFTLESIYFNIYLVSYCTLALSQQTLSRYPVSYLEYFLVK